MGALKNGHSQRRENNCFGSGETHTHNLRCRQEENRGCHTFTLGKVQGGEEQSGIEKRDRTSQVPSFWWDKIPQMPSWESPLCS